MFSDTKYSQKFSFDDNGVSVPACVAAADFRNIAISLIATGTADFSVRVLGSLQKTPPDFTSASAEDNQWSYIQLKDDKTSAYYDGDTGYVFSADGVVSLELNTSNLTWVAVEVFDYTDGELVAQFTFSNNV